MGRTVKAPNHDDAITRADGAEDAVTSVFAE